MKRIKLFFNIFRKKQPAKLYPVVDPKNIIYKRKEAPIENIIGLWLVLMCAVAYLGSSCSPTASLPNGCKYKLIAPKFTK